MTAVPQTSPQLRRDEEAREIAPRIKLLSNPELIVWPCIQTWKHRNMCTSSKPHVAVCMSEARNLPLFLFFFTLLHNTFSISNRAKCVDDGPFVFRRTSEHQAVFYGASCGQATVCRVWTDKR